MPGRYHLISAAMISAATMLGGLLCSVATAVAAAPPDVGVLAYSDDLLRREVTSVSIGLRPGMQLDTRRFILPDADLQLEVRPTGATTLLATLDFHELPWTDVGSAKHAEHVALRRQQEALEAVRRHPAVEWAYPTYRHAENGDIFLPTPHLRVELRAAIDVERLPWLAEATLDTSSARGDRRPRLRLLRLEDDPIAVASILAQRHPWIEKVSVEAATPPCSDGDPVTNCSFESGDTGWSVIGDSSTSSATARSGALALAVDAVEISSFQIDTQLSQCVQVSGSTTYDTGFFARMASGTASCWPRVLWHRNTTCSDFVAIDSLPAQPVAPGATWTLFSEEKTSPATAQSADFHLACTHGGADFEVLYDDAYFAAVLFRDGFETGDTTSWSSAQ